MQLRALYTAVIPLFVSDGLATLSRLSEITAKE